MASTSLPRRHPDSKPHLRVVALPRLVADPVPSRMDDATRHRAVDVLACLVGHLRDVQRADVERADALRGAAAAAERLASLLGGTDA